MAHVHPLFPASAPCHLSLQQAPLFAYRVQVKDYNSQWGESTNGTELVSHTTLRQEVRMEGFRNRDEPKLGLNWLGRRAGTGQDGVRRGFEPKFRSPPGKLASLVLFPAQGCGPDAVP